MDDEYDAGPGRHCLFNFIASHDGIGLRPAEGLLDDQEIAQLVATIQSFGGRISWRALEDGESRPYEMNISLYDALKGTVRGEDRWNFERFICAQPLCWPSKVCRRFIYTAF